MREIKVKLDSIDKIQALVNAVCKMDLDIELVSLNDDIPYILNAKSLLYSITRIDFSNEIVAELITSGEEAEKKFTEIMLPFVEN